MNSMLHGVKIVIYGLWLNSGEYHWGILLLVVVILALIVAVILFVKFEERKNEQFLDSIAQDSLLLKKADFYLIEVTEEKTKKEWHRLGKQTTKQNGDYRVDFERAVQQKILNLQSIGLTSDAILQYIHERGNNPTNRQADDVIRKAIDALTIRIEGKLAHEINEDGITPSEFFARKSAINGDSVGVYIIRNCTKSKYYVGQAKRLYFRVNQHFTGHGNGNVYADYKYGDQFRIKLITLRESGYDDLDKLERDLIRQYHANIDGYNKTSGNHSQ